VGYTARWTLPDRPLETPKYFLQSPKNFVYNLDAQTTHDYVIVTEGQLDALLVGGIALNGNTPNATQCSIIDQLDKQIILLPDFDKPGLETVKVAVKRGWSVSFPPWENCKDAGEAVAKYGRLFTVRSILDSAETSSTKIQILAKQHCK
jgi:DNA primase